LIAIAAVLAVGSLALLRLGEGESAGTALEPRPIPHGVEASSDSSALARDSEESRASAADPPAHAEPSSARSSTDPTLDVGAGPGIIRGRITAVEGVELPQIWTLIIEPHPFLKGHERAVTRRIEFTNGEREFKVQGLPLAGYNVQALAAGLNDVACSALLVEGSADVFVSPQFRRAGFIDGNVVDSRGAPVEGMTVTIIAEDTHARSSVQTDAAGNFAIRDVTDGNYSLAVGSPDAPLMKPKRLSFKAPSMRFPTCRLPETGSLRVLTVDPAGKPLANVAVSGFSTSGAALRAATDGRGAAIVRYLAPGKYRLEAKIEDGRKAGQWIDVSADQESVVQLQLKQ
jgi:hypothetical protein